MSDRATMYRLVRETNVQGVMDLFDMVTGEYVANDFNLRSRIAELEAALAWYADPENYLTVFDKPGQVVWNVMYEGGERARKALKGGE